MLTLAVAVFLVSLACQGLCGLQVPPTDEIAKLAATGNFEEASRLLKSHYEKSIKEMHHKSLQLQPLKGFDNGISLPPPRVGGAQSNGNGEYFYQSEASYHSIVNNNGNVKEEQDGLGVIDKNGAVTYYKPTSVTS